MLSFLHLCGYCWKCEFDYRCKNRIENYYHNFTSSKTSSRSLEDLLKTSRKDVLKKYWKMKNCYAEDVLKTSWRHILKTSWRHVLKMSWRHVLKTSWRHGDKQNTYWGYLYLTNLNVYLTNLYFTNLYLTNLRRI